MADQLRLSVDVEIAAPLLKTCTCCNEAKRLDAFSVRRAESRATLKTVCKECDTAYRRAQVRTEGHNAAMKVLTQKFCKSCKVVKDINEFNKSSHTKWGVKSYCKECYKLIYGDKFRVARRGRMTIDSAEHRLALFRGARDRARQKGLSFEISLDDISVPPLCPVLGIPLLLTPERLTDNTPTLDRRDPEKGYLKGNTVIISWLANRIKSNCGDPTVFERIAEYVRLGG